VLYDPDRHQAHSLNRVAVAIWKHCNGNNSVAALRQLAKTELGVPVEEGVVWRALAQLQSAHLLVEEDPRSAVSRRAILDKAGRLGIAAMATPLIASALVPVAAAAASRPSGLR
jgi:predicted metal-dependent phosphoesterase TrpH